MSVIRQEMTVVIEDARLTYAIESDKWKEKASQFPQRKKRKRKINHEYVSSTDDNIVQLTRETEQQSIPYGKIDN